MNTPELATESPMSYSSPNTDLEGELSKFLNILRILVREPSVVGSEDSFFRVLRRELEELGVNVQYYQGILVVQGDNPNHLILSAHVDRHGLICTGPNEFQYAAFIASNQSELTGDSVSEHMMYAVENRFQGQRVQAHLPYTGTYLGQGDITRSYICSARKNLIFELDGLDFVQPGTPVAFLDRLRVEEGYASAQLDNVLSAAILVYLFRRGFQGTALFTAQEEAGRSWRYALAWFQRQELLTQRLIVLDTSPYPSKEAAELQDLVLRRKDSNGAFAPEITEELAQTCDRLGIRYSYKDAYIEEQNQSRSKPLPLGRTELGRLVAATGGAINGTTLQIPTTGYHTSEETASLVSIAAALKLLMSYVP
jgi:putative aminopeptidase FrvX